MYRIFYFLSRPLTIIGFSVLLIAWIGYLVFFKWTAEAMVTSRHQEFIEHISAKKFRKCAPLISETYLDQWNFSKDDMMLSIRDIGGQFLILHITSEDFSLTTQDDTARSSSRLRFRGSGPGVAPLIVGEANRIKTPFVFLWRKENWRPWSWRIHRTENEGLPNFRGYRPGDFGAAMRNESR